MIKNFANRCKNLVFPVYTHELPKVIPLFFLFFLISFIYNLLRPLKISLVVTASSSGADVIPFLKAWAILPSAFFFAYLYAKLSDYLTREQVFFIFLAIFLASFLSFYIIYPNREQFELTFIANQLEKILPVGFRGFCSIIRHWDLSIFYVMSELWGNIMLTVLAWGFVNEIVNITEAKRFYAIFACGADSAGIFSGQYANLISSEKWEQTLSYTMLSVLFIGLIIAILYKYINHNHIGNHIGYKHNKTINKDQIFTNNKTSLIDSITLLIRSKYLRYLAIIVLCYNVIFNLFDVLWVEQLKNYYTTKNELNSYMNYLTFLTGILSASTALLLSGNFIRKFGWKNTALITPIIFTITGIGFFSCLLFKLFKDHSSFFNVIFSFLGNPINSTIIFLGTIQYCLTRACKYTVFDNTKEIAFIPLSNSDKRQGKSVIDTLVSRSSKSASAFIYQALLLFCSQLILTTPYVVIIILGLVAVWLYAILALNKQFVLETDTELKITQPAY